MPNFHSFRRCLCPIVFSLLAFSSPFAFRSQARADGWHNASLATATLDDWLSDIRAVVPDLDTRMERSQLKSSNNIEDIKKAVSAAGTKPAAGAKSPVRAASIQANLTEEQQALLSRKAGDCLEVLAYMDTKNIFPREFPTFDLKKIPEYRKAAKQLLTMMGPSGATAVVGQINAELMGANYQPGDVERTATYYEELLAIFRDQLASGQLSAEDAEALSISASGQKTANAPLAKAVLELLENYVNLTTLLKWSATTTDPARRKQMSAKFQKRLPAASQEELLTALVSPDASTLLRTAISNQLVKRLPEANIVDLLSTIENVADESLKKGAGTELAKRSPSFKEIEPQLPELTPYYASANTTVAQAAGGQLANAFQRAPLGVCLEWLGREDERLNKLIWQQIDGRIARADSERKAGYVQTALSVLKDSAAPARSRGAALDLLARLKQTQVVGEVVELLPRLPRELWPQTGSVLEQITGQKLGPKTGDGAAEVSVAVKKWREWWKLNGGM